LDWDDAELAAVDEFDHVVRVVDIDEAPAELGALIEESRPGYTARDHYIGAAGRPCGPDVMVSMAVKAIFRTRSPQMRAS
jgi:hypothetical protein